jgi:hypothetical protein
MNKDELFLSILARLDDKEYDKLLSIASAMLQKQKLPLARQKVLDCNDCQSFRLITRHAILNCQLVKTLAQQKVLDCHNIKTLARYGQLRESVLDFDYCQCPAFSTLKHKVFHETTFL